MEENTKRLQLQLQQEKQRVIQEKLNQEKELEAQMQKLREENQKKDQALDSHKLLSQQ